MLIKQQASVSGSCLVSFVTPMCDGCKAIRSHMTVQSTTCLLLSAGLGSSPQLQNCSFLITCPLLLWRDNCFIGFVLFRCHFVTNLTISDHDCGLRCAKGRISGWLREALWSVSSPSTLTKPSQGVCSGCRSEDSPLSLDVLFPDESCRLHVCFPSILKGHIHLRPRGDREHGI